MLSERRHAFRSEIEPSGHSHRYVATGLAYSCTDSPRDALRWQQPADPIFESACHRLWLESRNEMRCLVSHSESSPGGVELRVAVEGEGMMFSVERAALPLMHDGGEKKN